MNHLLKQQYIVLKDSFLSTRVMLPLTLIAHSCLAYRNRRRERKEEERKKGTRSKCVFQTVHTWIKNKGKVRGTYTQIVLLTLPKHPDAVSPKTQSLSENIPQNILKTFNQKHTHYYQDYTLGMNNNARAHKSCLFSWLCSEDTENRGRECYRVHTYAC